MSIKCFLVNLVLFFYSNDFLSFLVYDGVVDPGEGTEQNDGDEEDDNENENGGSNEERDRAPDNYSPEKMVKYFNELDRTGLSEDGLEAISIICDRVNNNSNIAGNVQLFQKSKSNIVKEMVKILVGRIPDQDRQKKIGPAGVKKWLKKKNDSRVFLFLTKDALVRIAASINSGMRLPQTSTFDDMIAKIVEFKEGQQGAGVTETAGAPNADLGNLPSGAATNPAPPADFPLTIKQEIMKSQLQYSFMKPLRGEQKEHTEVGHKTELPIALDWMRDFEKNLFHGFKILKSSLSTKLGWFLERDIHG